MHLAQETLTVATTPYGLIDVTAPVQAVVQRSGIVTGLCTAFLRHTSASLLIQENADPAVLRDLASFFAELVPEERDWEHDAEGPDDMPSHVRAALTRTSENIPVSGGRLVLGTWQALYVFEHRARPHRRELVVHVAGIR